MSILSQLKPAKGSRHKKHRLGRGKSCGYGGTSTKGHKGQKARSGYSLAKGFEGGQMSLIRRLPKFGFTNNQFKTKYEVVNISELNRFDLEVSPEIFYKSGMVKKQSLVKVLGNGKLEKKLKVIAHKFSRSASKAIKDAGGQVIIQKPLTSHSTQKKTENNSSPPPPPHDESQQVKDNYRDDSSNENDNTKNTNKTN